MPHDVLLGLEISEYLTSLDALLICSCEGLTGTDEFKNVVRKLLIS
jgi:hypothetical protein